MILGPGDAVIVFRLSIWGTFLNCIMLDLDLIVFLYLDHDHKSLYNENCWILLRLTSDIVIAESDVHFCFPSVNIIFSG